MFNLMKLTDNKEEIMTEQKLQELLQDMTLEEKVNQMLQLAGGFFTGDMMAMGPMAEKGFTQENISKAGSVLGALGAEKLSRKAKRS